MLSFQLLAAKMGTVWLLLVGVLMGWPSKGLMYSDMFLIQQQIRSVIINCFCFVSELVQLKTNFNILPAGVHMSVIGGTKGDNEELQGSSKGSDISFNHAC